MESVRTIDDPIDGAADQRLSQLAQRLGFTGAATADARARSVRWGAAAAADLTRPAHDEPNVLLLDEPTNDLDIETLTALEDVLDGWAGTLLVVSHDRYLLERACDNQVALLGDGKVRRPDQGEWSSTYACAISRHRRHTPGTAAASPRLARRRRVSAP
jgi:ATP-binding cassette subfamily F protein uup